MKRVLAILGLLVIACAGLSYAQSGGIKDINLSPALYEAVHKQIEVRNATGSNIAADKLLYVCGWTEVATAAIPSSPAVRRPKVCLADADVAGARAQYLSGDGIGNNANGVAIKSKRITGVNTNGSSVGANVYLSATAGSWTLTAPTPPAVVQIVGRVAIVSSSAGVVEINPDIESFQGVGSLDITDGAIAPADMGLPIRNETAGNLVAGDLVYVSSWNETEGRFLVAKADADAAGTAPAQYIIRGTIANNANGLAYRTYTITGANTLGSTVGNPVYLDTTAGGWTLSAPTGADDINQIVGRVRVVSATVGTIEVDLMSLNSPVSVGTNEIQANAVTNAKLAGLARGFIKRGSAAGAVEDYDANDDGKILVGDGNDLKSVAVSSDATLANTGALTIATGAVTSAKILNGTIANVDIADSTIQQIKLSPRARAWRFKTPAFMFLADNSGVASPNATTVNQMVYPEGTLWEYIEEAVAGTLVQTVTADGIDFGYDDNDDDGVQLYPPQQVGGSGMFTAGTDAFYAKMTAKLEDASGVDPLCLGFKTPQANADIDALAGLDSYGAAGEEVFAICVGSGAGVDPAVIHTYSKAGGAASVDTTLATHTWADGATHTLEIYVDAAKAVTYKIDGTAVTGAVALTASTDTFFPFIVHDSSGDVNANFYLSLFEYGLQ